ncbi:NHLP leader peptide family RiPP precursor [Nitrospirillum sp. BR 11163]|uniref:NHLP leader peptide family RiPP precursor n=1 Tax=Nitrospirillum sp. BR 11163 TaxID=3104323 RepID=UPI002AFF1141|nr:NHLP leader peptide family RiPP precursor [Nitrospirillum sp. BR 11163]MEA1675283.1 NHLP leader peptide family RiPP precursor [Nitrospirillum sp. BR 11163]
MNGQENLKTTSKIIAKAWSDDGFKARLLADPAAVLEAEGPHVPSGVRVSIVENTAASYTLVLPAKPVDMSDADLDQTGGYWCHTGGLFLNSYPW